MSGKNGIIRMSWKTFWTNWLIALFCLGAVNYLMLFVSAGALKGALVGVEICVVIATLIMEIGRLHDTDRSGWNILWGLLPLAGPIVLLVFFLQKGTEGANRFGEQPAK